VFQHVKGLPILTTDQTMFSTN